MKNETATKSQTQNYDAAQFNDALGNIGSFFLLFFFFCKRSQSLGYMRQNHLGGRCEDTRAAFDNATLRG